MANDNNNNILDDGAVTIKISNQTGALGTLNIANGKITIPLDKLHELSKPARQALYNNLPKDLRLEVDDFKNLVKEIAQIREINKGISIETAAQGIDDSFDALLDYLGMDGSQIPLIGGILDGTSFVTETMASAVNLPIAYLQGMFNSPPNAEQAEMIGLSKGLAQLEYRQQQEAGGVQGTLFTHISSGLSSVAQFVGNMFSDNSSNDPDEPKISMWQAIKTFDLKNIGKSFGKIWQAITDAWPNYEDVYQQNFHGASRAHAFNTLRKAGTVAGYDVIALADAAENGAEVQLANGSIGNIDNQKIKEKRDNDGNPVTPQSEVKDNLSEQMQWASSHKIEATVGLALAGTGLHGIVEGAAKGYITTSENAASSATKKANTLAGKVHNAIDGSAKETALKVQLNDAKDRAVKYGQQATNRKASVAGRIVNNINPKTSILNPRTWLRKPTEWATRITFGTGRTIAKAPKSATSLVKKLGRKAPIIGLGLMAVDALALNGSIEDKNAEHRSIMETKLAFTGAGSFIGGALGFIFGAGVGSIPAAAAGGGFAGGIADWIWGDEIAAARANSLVTNHGYHKNSAASAAQQEALAQEAEVRRVVIARAREAQAAKATREANEQAANKANKFSVLGGTTQFGGFADIADVQEVRSITPPTNSGITGDAVAEQLFGAPSSPTRIS
jgi:hypothetical protein